MQHIAIGRLIVIIADTIVHIVDNMLIRWLAAEDSLITGIIDYYFVIGTIMNAGVWCLMLLRVLPFSTQVFS